MARLRNTKTGSIVNVPDELAASLEGYEPVSESKPAAKKAAAKSDSK